MHEDPFSQPVHARGRSSKVSRYWAPVDLPEIPGETPQARRIREFHARTEREAAERRTKEFKPRAAPGQAFTTAYTIDWGKALGWEVIATETHGPQRTANGIKSRRRDCLAGSDVMFTDADGRLVLAQGAQRNEWQRHRASFEAAGGARICAQKHARFCYVVWDREGADPVAVEWWA